MITEFKSKKIDGIFLLMYIILFLFLLLTPILLLFEKKRAVFPLIVMESIFLIIISILVISIVKLKIRIEGNFLLIKIIFTMYKTDISKIYKVRKGETMWSGINKFGTSTNGLIIFTKHLNDLYITPENEDLFITELQKINPDIIIEKI
jgi:hypothetical protein